MPSSTSTVVLATGTSITWTSSLAIHPLKIWKVDLHTLHVHSWSVDETSNWQRWHSCRRCSWPFVCLTAQMVLRFSVIHLTPSSVSATAVFDVTWPRDRHRLPSTGELTPVTVTS